MPLYLYATKAFVHLLYNTATALTKTQIRSASCTEITTYAHEFKSVPYKLLSPKIAKNLPRLSIAELLLVIPENILSFSYLQPAIAEENSYWIAIFSLLRLSFGYFGYSAIADFSVFNFGEKQPRIYQSYLQTSYNCSHSRLYLWLFQLLAIYSQLQLQESVYWTAIFKILRLFLAILAIALQLEKSKSFHVLIHRKSTLRQARSHYHIQIKSLRSAFNTVLNRQDLPKYDNFRQRLA